MAQVLINKKQDNTSGQLLQQGGAAAGNAFLPGIGGIAGGMLGGKLAGGDGSGQVTGVATPQVQAPMAPPVPEAVAPMDQSGDMVNQNDALQRRLKMLNQISAQSQG